MQGILGTRDRNLRTISRFIGVAPTVLAIGVTAIPGVLDQVGGVQLAALTALALVLLCGCALLQSQPRGELWSIGVTGCAIGVMLLTTLVESNPGTGAILALVGGISMGSSAYVLALKPRFRPLLAGLAAATIATTAFAFVPAILTLQGATGTARSTAITAGIALGAAAWLTPIVITLWLARATQHVGEAIIEIRESNRLERMASEREAERHRNARLLHDTVLATLTLISHDGRGVPAEALRANARNDATLLALLRSGELPLRANGGSEAGEDERLALELRAARLGLSVNWHGSREIELAGGKRDALFGAIAECLENVRRHAGVLTADVTLTIDEVSVRALVTDSGVGFDPSRLGTSLGFTESILGRVRAVGGNARVFSSPGAGTTVVLEVPR